MAFDTHSIFGYSTIASVTSQSASTLVVVVATGDGALFAINQQLTIAPANTQTVLGNAMICRITTIATDTLTIDVSVGSREGSNTRTALVGDAIANTITPKALKDMEALLGTALIPQNITQTNLTPSFTAAANTTEQEVVNLRFSLPIINRTCTVKVTFAGYVTFGAGNNTVRIRIGTSTTYLSNTEYQNLYVGAAKTIETFYGYTTTSINLGTQTYVVISVQNDASNPASLSASTARTSLLVEVYG